MMGDNDVRAWTYRCIVLVFQGICSWLACLMFIVWRPPYPLYDGRRTHYTTTAERCVPQPPYNNPYNVIGLKQHRKHEKETSETHSKIAVNFR